MNKVTKAITTNFDLLDFLYVHYKVSDKKEDDFFFHAEYIEKKDEFNLDYIKSNPDKFNWEILCYNHYVPWLEDLIDIHYDKLDWFRISKNPKINWNEKLLNKYWDKLLINSIISHSQMFWNENLVRFVISKHEKDSTKIFWLEKFSTITNIDWNLKMIIDFPTSYWIREVINAETLELEFEELKNNKKHLNKDIFKYLQASKNLHWTIEMILEFKVLIDFKILSLSKNVNWSNELIFCYSEDLDFELMSKNQSIPIDKFILTKFKNRWNFKSLSSNSKVMWSVDLLKEFISELDLNLVLCNPIEGVDENFIHEYRDYFYWGTGCGNYTYTPAPIAGCYHIPISIKTLSEKAINWETGECKPYWEEKGYYYGEWHRFSSNHHLTALHLDKFEDKLSWDVISSNENIKITSELLLKHSNKWVWSKILKRNDFQSEHFYAIHQYLNFDLLSANSLKIFNFLESDKDEIFSYIKDYVEIAGEFRHSLRIQSFSYYDDVENDYRQLSKIKRDLITKQCGNANIEHASINKHDDRYDSDAQEMVYYDKIHYWLRKYFRCFEEISHVSDTFERKTGYTPEREIQVFFYLYLKAEEDFKKNYFQVYKRKK